MTEYVALLRGINVGGNNLIKMAALKICFEKQGLHRVVTYIQSGNVLFESSASAQKLVPKLESAIVRTFKCQSSVVLRSRKELAAIVELAPKGFGKKPDEYRYDVIFLMEALTAKDALKKVPIKEGVDEARAGVGVLYFSRLVEKASQSKLSRIASLSIYKSMTIRNWNTTTKLLGMMNAEK